EDGDEYAEYYESHGPWGKVVWGEDRRGERSAVAAFLPLGDEDVRLAHFTSVTVGCPHESRTIGAEHREAIELLMESHLFEVPAVEIHEEQVEIPASRVHVVGGEDDAIAVRREEGREIGAAELGHLALSAAVRIHDPDLHPVRPHHPALQQSLILRH